MWCNYNHNCNHSRNHTIFCAFCTSRVLGAGVLYVELKDVEQNRSAQPDAAADHKQGTNGPHLGKCDTDYRANKGADVHYNRIEGNITGPPFLRAEFEQDVKVAEVDAWVDQIDPHSPHQDGGQVWKQADQESITGSQGNGDQQGALVPQLLNPSLPQRISNNRANVSQGVV